MTHPANHGLCLLASIEPAFAPAKCTIWTSLTEKFPIFDANVAHLAELCCESHLHVHLTMTHSKRGDVYVSAIHPIDFTKPSQPCMGWRGMARRIANGPPSAWFFYCADCHQRTFIEPPMY